MPRQVEATTCDYPIRHPGIRIVELTRLVIRYSESAQVTKF